MNEHNQSNTPPVPEHLFRIIDNIQGAFGVLRKEGHYIMRLAMPVLFLKIALTAAQSQFSPSASVFEQFLWQLPGNVMMGWLICSITRLIIFDERLQNLPITDVRFMQYRAGLIKTSIFIGLLFQACLVIMFFIFENAVTAVEKPEDVDSVVFIFLLAFIGLTFWGIRFMLLPLVAAVDYPLRVFLRQIQGFRISFNMFGMNALCTLPILICAQIILLSLLAPLSAAPEVKKLLFQVSAHPFEILVNVLLTTSLVLALKEMLGKNLKV